MEQSSRMGKLGIVSITDEQYKVVLPKRATHELLFKCIVLLGFLLLVLQVVPRLPSSILADWRWLVLGVISTLIAAYGIWSFMTGVFTDLHQDKSIRRQKLRRHLQTELRRWVSFLFVAPFSSLLFYELSRYLETTPFLAGVSGVLGLMLGAGIVHLAVPPPHVEDDNQDIVRGSRLLDYKAALRASQQQTQTDPMRVLWGGVWLPAESVYQHFMVEGTTGSGKTVAIRMLMESVLPRIGQGHNHRALIYDPKNELPSLLAGMNLACPVKLMNPFDQRAWAWDIAKDITDPAMAVTMAEILIPPDTKSSQPYFREAAAMLLSGIIEALMVLKPGAWTLRDLLLIFRSKERIRQVLEAVPEVSSYAEIYLKQSDATVGSILSTGFNKLNQFKQVAALWEKAFQKMSLREWITEHEESILVLGSRQKFNKAMQAVNNLIIQVVLSELLDQPDNASDERTSNRRTFLIIDELTSLGALEILPQALCQVRSKGGSVVLGFQERCDVQNSLGYENAQTIFSNISSKLYMRVSHHLSAENIAKELGTHERLEIGAGSQFYNGGATRGDSEQDAKRERKLILPSELMQLPPAGPASGVVPGFAKTPWIRQPYRVMMPWELVASRLSQRATEHPNYLQRPEGEQRLVDFSPQEMDKLGVSYPKPKLVRRK